MNLIKKLLRQYDTRRMYLMKDIYFVIDFSNENIIPIVFNDDYTSVLRLDKKQVCENLSSSSPNDTFCYTPSYIYEKPKSIKSDTSFIYKNKDYEINKIATKMLFAKNQKNMDFLEDIQILNSNELEGKYYLAKYYKNLKKHVYSNEVAYTSQKEILSIVHFVMNSKTFKKEIEKFHNIKQSADSRSF